jgi:hypothetical protein
MSPILLRQTAKDIGLTIEEYLVSDELDTWVNKWGIAFNRRISVLR